MAKNLKLTMVIDAKTGKVRTAIDGVVRDVESIGDAASKSKRRAEEFTTTASSGFSSLGRSVDTARSGINSISGSLRGLTGIIGAIGLTSLATSAMDTFRSFESLKASLKTVTGSAEDAQSAFSLIQDFATQTPYDLEQVVTAFVKLKAMGLDPSKEALNSYGNTASAMGKSLDQMIEAVADAATGEFERLKEFGIKASQQGDQVTFTFQGIKTTVGKNAKEIQQYLLDIGNVEFAGAMADQMETVNGKISNLGDAFAKLQRDFIEKSGAADAAKAALSGLTDAIGMLTNNIGPLTTAAALLGKGFAALMVARTLGPLLSGIGAKAMAAAGGMTAAGTASVAMKAQLIAGVTWANKSKIAMAGLSKVLSMMGGPVGIAITALGSLAIAFAKTRSENRKLIDALHDNPVMYNNAKDVKVSAALEDALAKVEAEMARLEKTSGKTSAAYQAQEKSAQLLRKQLDGLKKAEFAKTKEGQKALKQEADRRKQITGLTQDYRDLLLEYDQENIKLAKVNDEKRKLEKLLKNGIIDTKEYKRLLGLMKTSTSKLAKATGDLTKKTRDQKKAADEVARATAEQQRRYRDLLREINPLQRASDDYQEKLAVLNQELADGRITTEEYDKVLWELDQKMLGFSETVADTGDAVKYESKKIKDSADPMAKAWERAAGRIDSSFADAFKSGFRNFKDFGRNIKSALKDMLAEMAYQLVRSKFVQMMGQLAGSGGFWGGMASLVPGVASAGAGGGAAGAGAGGVVPVGGAGGISGIGVGASTIGGVALGAGVGYLGGSLLEGVIGGGQRTKNMGALGGAIGTAIAPGIGTAIGTVLGSSVGAISAGYKKKHKETVLNFDYSGGDLSGQVEKKFKKKSLTTRGNRTRRWSEFEEMDAEMTKLIDGALDTYVNAARSMGEAFTKSGTAMRRRVERIVDDFAASGKIDIKGLNEEEVQAKLQAWVDENGARLLKAVTPQFSRIIDMAGDRAGELVQPLLALSQYIGESWEPQVRETLMTQVANTRDTVNKQLLEYDGTVEATKNLSVAVQQRYQLEAALLQQVDQISQSVTQATGSIKDRIDRSLRSDAQQIEWLTKQQNELKAQLEKASDPEEIQRLVQQIAAYSGEQLSMLSKNEIANVADEVKGFMDEVDSIAQSKLAEIEAKTKAGHDAVADAVEKSLKSGVGVTIEAAQMLNAAGGALSKAANSIIEAGSVNRVLSDGMKSLFGGLADRVKQMAETMAASKEASMEAASAVTEVADGAAGAVQEVGEKTASAIEEAASAVSEVADAAAENTKEVVTGLGLAVEGVGDALGTVTTELISTATDTREEVAAAGKAAVTNISTAAQTAANAASREAAQLQVDSAKRVAELHKTAAAATVRAAQSTDTAARSMNNAAGAMIQAAQQLAKAPVEYRRAG